MRSLALAALAASALALAPPGAPRHLKTRRTAVVSEPDAKAKVSSANAKRQVGNDAFLNKDLRARARGGTGVVNDAKLKIGIVGAGLARGLLLVCAGVLVGVAIVLAPYSVSACAYKVRAMPDDWLAFHDETGQPWRYAARCSGDYGHFSPLPLFILSHIPN